MQLYYGLLQLEVRKKDVWSTLSADEQEAIRESINDVENNRLTSYNELMAVVSDVFLEN
jgi:TRAP-type C4-dicarboxylate transport system substrate-binding protein